MPLHGSSSVVYKHMVNRKQRLDGAHTSPFDMIKTNILMPSVCGGTRIFLGRMSWGTEFFHEVKLGTNIFSPCCRITVKPEMFGGMKYSRILWIVHRVDSPY